jgi:hypothetical protein
MNPDLSLTWFEWGGVVVCGAALAAVLFLYL